MSHSSNRTSKTHLDLLRDIRTKLGEIAPADFKVSAQAKANLVEAVYYLADNAIIAAEKKQDQTQSVASKTVTFDSLPLGARFRYPGKSDVWVKLENGGTGLVAEWRDPQLNWPGQGIYSFADSERQRASGMVEWIDQPAHETAGDDALRSIARLLPYAQQYEPADAADIEAQQSVVAEAEMLLARRSPLEPRETKPPLGQEPWRCSLPVITVQMLGDFGQEGFFEKTDEPVHGVLGVGWSQAAVDFACLIQGRRAVEPRETTAPLSPNAPKRERPQKAPNKDGVTYIRELVTYCGLIQHATFGLPYSRELEFLLEQLADAKDDALDTHHAYIDLKYPQTTSSPEEQRETPVRIGPADPDNDMVICPTCTSQFRAIPVNVQTKLIDAETFKRSIRIALEMWPEESPEEPASTQKHYPEEWGPSDARKLSCVCGDPDPGHMNRPAVKASAPHVHVWGKDPTMEDWAVCECGEVAEDWYCPTSSDHICHYNRGNHDSCDFCGLPEERK